MAAAELGRTHSEVLPRNSNCLVDSLLRSIPGPCGADSASQYAWHQEAISPRNIPLSSDALLMEASSGSLPSPGCVHSVPLPWPLSTPGGTGTSEHTRGPPPRPSGPRLQSLSLDTSLDQLKLPATSAETAPVVQPLHAPLVIPSQPECLNVPQAMELQPSPVPPLPSCSEVPQLAVWAGNKSRAGVARLGVRLLRAAGLPHALAHSEADPYAIAKCGGQQFRTAAITRVQQPASAVLKIKVFDDLRCWKSTLLGQLRIPIKSVAEAPRQFSEAMWYPLRSRSSHVHGQLQLQLIYLLERFHRPLTVMCATWNVGNQQPPEELGSWLRGAADRELHIIAIGLQECSYRENADKSKDAEQVKTCSEDGRAGLSTPLGTEASSSSLQEHSFVCGSGLPVNSASAEGPQPIGSSSAAIACESSGSKGISAFSGELQEPRCFTAPPICKGSPTPQTVAQVLTAPSDVPNAAIVDSVGIIQGASPAENQQIKKHGRLLRKLESGTGGGQFRDLVEEWLHNALGDQSYWLARSVHMGQIRLLVFVRNDIFPAVTVLGKGSQPTGVAGVATNKGGVAIALRVWDTEICFVNSHLAAHQAKCKTRNQQYHEIVRGLRLDSKPKRCHMDVLTAYHHIFWMGDLNYRLEYGQQAATQASTPTADDFSAILKEVQAGRFTELIQRDQLRREMAAQRAFLGFQEAAITFPPSFKVQRVCGLEWCTQRSPAWCDRVLFRSNLPLKQACPTDYFAATDIATSDHKPVAAIFSVPTVWHTPVEGHAGKNISVIISALRATGLFLLRDNRKTTHFPNPQLVISGTCIRGKAHSTPVCRDTREPTWPDDIVLPLHRSAIQDLVHYRLLVCILDRSGGLLAHRKRTLGRCVLPLADAATHLMVHSSAVPFSVMLEYNGVPAGTLEGNVRLIVQTHGTAAALHNSLMSTLSLSWL